MKKTLLLLLCSVAIVIFSSCNDDSNNNGGTTPPVDTVDTTAKPKLGYLDFNHWYDIMCKDIETVKPLIRGTYIKDTITLKKKSLVYAQETDGGTFIVQYLCNSKNILVHIYAELFTKLDTTVLKTPAELFKHSKIISDEMNTFVKSFNNNRGTFQSAASSMYKKKEVITSLNSHDVQDQEKYELTWTFINKISSKGLADDESVSCYEMWQIVADVPFPDAHTPAIRPVMMFESYAKDGSYAYDPNDSNDLMNDSRIINVQFTNWVWDESDITHPDI